MDNIPSFTEENMEWYRKMLEAYDSLITDEEKRKLAEWEKIHLGKSDGAIEVCSSPDSLHEAYWNIHRQGAKK